MAQLITMRKPTKYVMNAQMKFDRTDYRKVRTGIAYAGYGSCLALRTCEINIPTKDGNAVHRKVPASIGRQHMGRVPNPSPSGGHATRARTTSR